MILDLLDAGSARVLFDVEESFKKPLADFRVFSAQLFLYLQPGRRFLSLDTLRGGFGASGKCFRLIS